MDALPYPGGLFDMGALFQGAAFDYRDEEIGGRGSVHLYVATKPR